MSAETLALIEEFPLVKQYSKRIPQDLWDIFLPQSPDGLETFSAAIKALRLKEEERNYVMELQQQYELPLRPNLTVKETMIQVRLNLLQERKRRGQEADDLSIDDSLPVDPLE